MSWPLTNLDDLLDDIQPGFASGQNESDGVLQVRMNNVKPDGSWDWSKERRVPATLKQLDKYSLQSGDILFNTTNSPEQVGKSALFQGAEEPVSFSNHFLRLRVKKSKLSESYLTRYFAFLWQRKVFENMVDTWVNQATVQRDSFLALKIPLPPLAEQKRIAAILDKADSLRRKNQQAIHLADQFLRAMFLELFGDPVTNPKGWNIKPLGEMVKNLDGRRIPVKASDRAVLNGKYRYYGASGIIDQVDDYIFDERTLLIGEDGANLLARSTPIAFIVDGKYWVNNHAHVLAENGNLPLEYLMYSINMRSIAAYVTGSAQPKLNQEMLNKIPIQIPNQQLLDKFVKLIGIASNLKAKFSIIPNEVLFNSLSQKAFAGKL